MTTPGITDGLKEKWLADDNALAATVQSLRAAGRTIALTNGCYDILHVGHLRSLRDAKQAADVLIVALNADSSVSQWKGPGYPVVPEHERAEMMAGFDCVDYVFVFTDPSVDRLLEVIQPDAYCKGPEYSLDNLPEADTVRRLGVRFCNVGDPKDHSSTSIADRIVALHKTRPLTSASKESQVETHDGVEIISRTRVFDGFLNLDEVHLRHELPDGTMSPAMVRQNVERGDGAAVLVVNTDRNTVVFTRQFRYAAWARSGDGWIIEIPAGTVAADGDPEAVARSEVAEEVGYTVEALTPLATFYASPGTTSERVWLYAATVTDADRHTDGGGLADEHEYIEVIEMPIDEALRKLDAREINDAKTVIALQSLKTK